MNRIGTCLIVACSASMASALLPTSAPAVDGSAFSSEPTYYESTVSGLSPDQLDSPSPALPSALHLSDSTASVAYSAAVIEGDRLDWTVSILDLVRSHERIDALYHVILVLPLPVDPSGRDSFEIAGGSLKPREGTPGKSVPLIYGGERVLLKRTRALERALLPNLVAGSGAPDKLPDLTGTGYDYTFWDTILRYDASYGPAIQVLLDVRYSTDGSVVAPDASDERLKAYLVTWIPQLDPTIPPFAVRMDIVDPR